jgi:hypothetical protein
MKRLTLSTILVFSLALMTYSQGKFLTKTGYISFFSHTPIEDIKAENNQVSSVLDSQTGDLVFNVLMKSFNFKIALMQEHFNENYVESDKYPKAVFKGKIANISVVDFKKNGVYNVDVEGEMDMHGVKKTEKAKGTLEVKDGKIIAKSIFSLKIADYNITVPGMAKEKIAESVEITVDMSYAPFENK